jgi:hypothetical protein
LAIPLTYDSFIHYNLPVYPGAQGDKTMKNIGRVGRSLSPWGATFLVMGFVFCHADGVQAQSNWSGILNRVPEAIGTHSRAPQNQRSTQSKTEMEGFVTIQSISVGQIPKYINTSGGLDGSVITESNGNVGIGTTSPGLHLDVQQTSSYYPGLNVLASTGARATIGFGVNGTTANTGWIMGQDYNANGTKDFYLFDLTNSATSRLYIDTSGHVGIGTTTPGEKLTLAGNISFTDRGTDGTGDIHLSNNNSGVRIFAANTLGLVPDGAAFQFFGNASPNFPGMGFIDSGASNSAAIIFRTAQAGQGVAERMRITAAGNIGIGTSTPDSNYMLHVTGAVRVDGNIAAKYQDVAEWVPSSRAIPAGTVVVLDADQSNHVLPSSRAYDTRVAGVVSAKPGLILGEGGEGKVMVATTGRVRVKVDATSAPIRVGDLLVTSDKEGIAMRSQPLDLGGTPIHRPGTLIGKALEPLAKGTGEILVLLSLQ